MKKIFMFGVLALFLISFVVAENNDTNETCSESWTCTPWSSCINNTQTRTCTDSNSCGTTTNKPSESQSCTTTADTSNKVCCHKFGYGNQMKKVNSQYQWIDEESCVTPEGFTGGGREIVDDEYCKKKNKISVGQEDECPEGCTCTGSTTKCPIDGGGRIMTVTAGKSGNIIVQVKGVNMSTQVQLYKQNDTLYGTFKNNQTRIIKIMPDQVQEKIQSRIQAKLGDYEIELDEDGYYQVQTKKKARLFLLIPVREKVKAQVHSETGEIIKIRNPWWGFLARDVKE